MIKKTLSKMFEFLAGGFGFIIVGFVVSPIIAAFIAELLKTNLSLATKSLILAYAIFGGFLLGLKANKDQEQ